MDANRPHRAVIWIQAEVHELTKIGECSGDAVHKIPSFPIIIDGENQAITNSRLADLVAELKSRFK